VRVPRPLILLVTAGFAATLSGSCSSPGAVGKRDVEKQVKDQLTSTTGTAADSITCPGDLTATTVSPGTSMRCAPAAGDTRVETRSG